MKHGELICSQSVRTLLWTVETHRLLRFLKQTPSCVIRQHPLCERRLEYALPFVCVCFRPFYILVRYSTASHHYNARYCDFVNGGQFYHRYYNIIWFYLLGNIQGRIQRKLKEGSKMSARKARGKILLINIHLFIKSIKFNCYYAYADRRERVLQIRHALLSIRNALLSMRHTIFQKFSHTAWTKGGHGPPPPLNPLLI